jgi:hypothetical protein
MIISPALGYDTIVGNEGKLFMIIVPTSVCYKFCILASILFSFSSPCQVLNFL